MNTYDQGDLLRITGTFTDSSGTVTDPAVVKFQWRNEALGVTSTYTYGANAELVKQSTGVYYVDVDLTNSGRYLYRMFSTGSGQGAETGVFYVPPAGL